MIILLSFYYPDKYMSIYFFFNIDLSGKVNMNHPYKSLKEFIYIIYIIS
jgi:hypothetical protein